MVGMIWLFVLLFISFFSRFIIILVLGFFLILCGFKEVILELLLIVIFWFSVNFMFGGIVIVIDLVEKDKFKIVLIIVSGCCLNFFCIFNCFFMRFVMFFLRFCVNLLLIMISNNYFKNKNYELVLLKK